MNRCGDTPIRSADIARAEKDILSAYTQARIEGQLPPNSQPVLIEGYPGVLGVTVRKTVDVEADPVVLSCYNGKQIQGIMYHEVGHYREPQYSDPFLHAQPYLAWTVVGAFLVTAAIGGLRSSRLNALVPAWLTIKRCAVALTSLVIAHTTSGLAHVWAQRADEFRADAFMAYTMNTAEPMISALRDAYKISIDQKTLKLAEWQTFGYRIKNYGVIGMRLDNHPSKADRITALLTYKPSIVRVGVAAPQLAR